MKIRTTRSVKIRAVLLILKLGSNRYEVWCLWVSSME